MIKDFLSALTYDMSKFAAKHSDFFDLKESERGEKLKPQQLPTALKAYLSKVSAKDFMHDLALTLKFIEKPKEAKIEKNNFFVAVVEFFSGGFAHHVDALETDFYLAKSETRKKMINEVIKGESLTIQSIRNLLVFESHQQIASMVNDLAKRASNAPHIIVQSPREINVELKKDIRKKLREENPHSFPTFQINKKLIGGIRIFKDGKVADHSWLSRVLRFTSLTAA